MRLNPDGSRDTSFGQGGDITIENIDGSWFGHQPAAWLRPDGRIVVLGGVSADDGPRRLEPDKIVAGGKNNTVAEFRELARQAGLELLAAEQQPSGYFVVECRPA